MKITLTQFRPNTAEAVWTDCFAQAIAELHKAGGGVLTVPTGEYSTGPIELCSNMELHLEPGITVLGNEPLLIRLFANLIANAYK